MNILRVSAVGLLLAAGAGAAHAGEWQADRLRGVVLMMVDGEWEPIARGEIIDDSRVIRTGANGRVTFRSGEQVVELERNTQIQISAVSDRDHTWILHAGGQITADVEARDVEHFGVVTEHMVAVVKGTRFTVNADGDFASVGVERGNVSVNESDRGLSVTLAAGQQASSSSSGQLSVSGSGDLPPVRDAAGRVVEPAPVAPVAGNGVNTTATANSTNAAPAVPGNAGAAPGRNDTGPQGQANGRDRAGPGPQGIGHGHERGGPGRSGDAPGHDRGGPGRSNDGPGQGNGGAGRSDNGPGHGNGGPGRSDDGPGRGGDGPGRSGGGHDHGGNGPGNSGNTPAAEKSSGKPGKGH